MYWFFGIGLFAIYLVLLVSLGLTTWNKGHKVWFIVGLIFPPLWLAGALMKAKPGSKYAKKERDRWGPHGS